MRKTFIAVAFVAVASFMLAACATVPPERSPRTFHQERTATKQALADAKARGAAEDCPTAYNQVAWQYHGAVDVFWSCRTAEAIAMMKDARAKAEALCGEKVMMEEKVWVIGDANFDTNKDEIKPGVRPVLDDAVKVMKENPKTKFVLHGYTDSRGSDEYNMDLSIRRAKAVKKYLTDRGIDGSRLKVVGHGERNPIAPNYTDEGMAKNRRVEINQVVEK